MQRGVAFSVDPRHHRDVKEFAAKAVGALKLGCPHCLSDFIIRVDIMQMQSGRFVVNEFESHEAFTVSTSQGFDTQQLVTESFLINYWFIILKSI